LRECVYLEGDLLLNAAKCFQDDSPVKEEDADTDRPLQAVLPPADLSPHPVLCILLHPYALATIISILQYIVTFRNFFANATPRRESSQIAKEAIVDLVDLSPVNLAELQRALEDCLKEVEAVDDEQLQTVIVSLKPPAAMHQLLVTLANRLCSPNICDKPRLFYSTTDQMERPQPVGKRDGERSIISKEILVKGGPKRQCIACGGRSATYPGSAKHGQEFSTRWDLWLKRWYSTCICGGLWVQSLG